MFLVYMGVALLISVVLAGAMGGLGLMGLGKYARRKGWFKDGEMPIPGKLDKAASKKEAMEEKERIRPLHDDLTGLIVGLGYKKADASALAMRILKDGGPQDMQSMTRRAIAAIGKR